MGRNSQKNAVEDYLRIGVVELRKQNFLRVSAMSSGYMQWGKPEAVKASIGFDLNTLDASEIRFHYKIIKKDTGESSDFDYKVSLLSTPCHYGGVRWWFKCPIQKNGVRCGKRVGVLYMRWDYFGCRDCMELIYQSSKDSHKHDAMFKGMGIDPKTGNKMLKLGYL